ncbi:MAG: hypothetical protein ACTSRS_01765 [Candidatus Helarchaeota archaeon]
MTEEKGFFENAELKRKGKEFLKRIKMSYEYFSQIQSEEAKDLKPLKKGDIPKLAVLVGVLDPFFYDLYKLCDGKRSVSKLSQILDLEPAQVKVLIDELAKHGLIEKIEK